MKRLHDFLAELFGFETQREKDIIRLARAEYGRDWQYAYYQLMEGKQPSIGVKQ
jgi:hypothetical protein